MAELLQMPSISAPDTLAREQALDVERSWIVEAPAGSGKTGLLIQRYLRLLAHSSVTDPEQVLAITFTKAATEEIRTRILKELRQAHDSSNDEVKAGSDYDCTTRSQARAVLQRDCAMNWRLLDEPRRLRIRTIDAVCAEIARSLPVLCGGNGSLIPVEEPSSLYLEAARRTWSHLGGDDAALSDALRALLLHRDGNLEACVSLVAEMLGTREQWGSLVPLREEDLTDEALDSRLRDQLDRSLEQVVCEGLSRLSRAFPKQILRRLASIANTLSERSGYGNQPSPLAVCRELRGSPSDAAEHLVYWRALAHLLIAPSKGTWRNSFNSNHVRFETNAKDKILLKEILFEIQGHPDLLNLLNEIGTLPPSRFPAEQWPITKALFRVLRQSLAELQIVFSESGQSDFTEPSLLARYALRQQHGANNLEIALGTELKHLLVDEMQDTSARQYELIEHLTNGWPDEGKTVFLVGDPKQSIYLFRQARVERFVKTMRTGLLGNLPVEPLYLTANFRSQARLVAAFNHDFSKVFPLTSARSEDVAYVQASPTRKLTPELDGVDGAAWHLTVASGDAHETRHAIKAQVMHNAQELRGIVEQWRARPLPAGRTSPWRIAVLVQSRNSLARVLPELRRDTPIPFRALKIDTLDERREILDLLALTRALMHPADRTAWLAVLHAPWCGLGMADLHTLTGRDDDRFLGSTVMDLIAAHGTEISTNGILRLERTWPVLDAAVRAAPHVRLPERVERTWRSLGGNLYLDDTSLRNANTFLDLLRTLDREEGEVRLSALMRRLKCLYASPDNIEDAIDLVTIHSSKGLEWDVVLVPELERRAPATKSRLFEWEELLDGGVILAPIAAKGDEAALLNRWLRSLRSRRETAERKRLFYVACTRAREELHLFGTASMRQDGSVTATSGSLLEAAWPAAENRIAALDEAALATAPRYNAVFDLAAAAAGSDITEPAASPLLESLPLSVRPFPASMARASSDSKKEMPGSAPLSRPHGSFASRCLGIAVHTFLEEAAAALARGTTIPQLLSDLSLWEPRMRAVIRANGLALQTVDQQLRTVMTAVRGTLADPVGQWLLGARSQARSELALTSWDERARHSRIDRIFRAGATPGETGDQYLWIIDYKTASDAAAAYDHKALQYFLDREQQRHQPQLKGYARLMGEDNTRVGLWFPLLRQLRWWTIEDNNAVPASNPHATPLSAP